MDEAGAREGKLHETYPTTASSAQSVAAIALAAHRSSVIALDAMTDAP